MIIIGVDLGLNGSIAVIDGYKLIELIDIPVYEVSKKRKGKMRKKRMLDIFKIYDFFHISIPLPPIHIFIEKTQPIPSFKNDKKQGEETKRSSSQANWNLGYAEGLFRGILISHSLECTLVYPQTWQKHFSISNAAGGTKVLSHKMAKQLFPDAVLETKRGRKLDGRADALLIAVYGNIIINGGGK